MGTLKTAIQALLGWKNKNAVYNSKYVVADNIVFSSFGKDIHVSDIVKTAIHRVAEEVSKCSVYSVIEKSNPKTVAISDDSINAVLHGRVNPLCGLKDFLYKVAWLTLVNKNCFIYWQYNDVPVGNGYVKRVTKGFYPIQAANVKMYTQDDEMRIELSNPTQNIVLDMPYSDVIHIRHGYGANQFLGGAAWGGADNRELLENLQTMKIIKEGIPKSLEASLSLKGVLSMKTVADVDKKTVTRDEFESHLFNSKYGIVATDYESDFTPVNISAADIPTNTLEFVRNEILAPFGVSLPVYLGKYSDDEWTAFYQTAVEGLLLEIQQAFRIVLFTPRELSFGHNIKVYDRLVQSLSFSKRKELVDMAIPSALLSRDEQREILGFEPDGKPTLVSLNYIDTNIANEYQLKSADAAKQADEPTEPQQTDEPTDGAEVQGENNDNENNA